MGKMLTPIIHLRRLLSALRLRSPFQAFVNKGGDEFDVSTPAPSIDQLKHFARLCSEWYWEQDCEFRFTMLSNWHSKGMPNSASLIGKALWDLPNRHSDDFWLAHQKLLNARLPFVDFEYHFYDQDRQYWICASGEPMFNQAGSFTGYRGACRDITAQKKMKHALRTSEGRFKEIVDLMPVSLFVKDANSRIIFLNAETEKQWGVRLEDVRGTDVSDRFQPDHVAAFLEADRRAYEEKRVIDFEETVWMASMQALRTVHTYKKPVFDKAGRPRYLIGVRVDITDKKQVEAQLRASRQAIRELAMHQTSLVEQERTRIARDIHDELGQNLLAIRIEASRLAQRAGERHLRLYQSAAETLRTIDGTIRSVREIINNLRPAVLDLGLSAALDWQVREFSKHSNISCTLDLAIDEDTLSLSDDCALILFRVAQESLTNVQKHAKATAVHVSLNADGDHIILETEDNGVGIANLERRPEAFGILGMTERVKTIGGTLQITSGTLGGTTLIARLPMK